MSITLQQEKGLLEASRTIFLPEIITDDKLDVVTEEGEESAVIDGVKVPLFTDTFSIMVVQNGHSSSDAKFKNKAGKIFVDGLDDFFDERILLPMTVVRYGQNLYPGAYQPGTVTKPICYSVNGVYPSRKVADPMNAVCAEIEEGRDGQPYLRTVCPKAMWNDDQKPECRRYIVLSFLDITDPETPFPVRMQLKGSAYAAWNAINQSYKRTANVARLKRQNINDYVLKLSVEDKGTYYVPVFTPVYSDEKPSKYLELRARYRNIINRAEAQIMAREEDAANEGIESSAANAPKIDTGDAQAQAEAAVEFAF